MNRTATLLFAASVLLGVAGSGARAQAPASRLVDSGRWIVYSHGRPIGIEDFEYEVHGESLLVTANTRRTTRSADGASHTFEKSMGLIADFRDFALIGYTSSQKEDGRALSHHVYMGDTALTVTLETADGRGSADRLARPPGRFYVMDGGMWTLFDLLARTLHDKLFAPRSIWLLSLGDENATSQALATPGKPDTVSWGGRRVITSRIEVTDESGAFTLWLSPSGQMLRLESPAIALAVQREPPQLPSRAPRPAPPPKPKPRPKPR
jgi:hypothetical protein